MIQTEFMIVRVLKYKGSCNDMEYNNHHHQLLLKSACGNLESQDVFWTYVWLKMEVEDWQSLWQVEHVIPAGSSLLENSSAIAYLLSYFAANFLFCCYWKSASVFHVLMCHSGRFLTFCSREDGSILSSFK